MAETSSAVALLCVERERPDEFADIPRFMRRFAKSTVAIRYLKRTAWSGFIDAELDEIRRLGRRQIVAVLVGLGATCAAIASRRWWGWNWG